MIKIAEYRRRNNCEIHKKLRTFQFTVLWILPYSLRLEEMYYWGRLCFQRL